MTYAKTGALLGGLVLATLVGCSSKSPGPPDTQRVIELGVSKSTPFMVEGRDYRVLLQFPYVIDGQVARYYARVGSSSMIADLSPGDPAGDRSKDNPGGDSLIRFDSKSKTVLVLAHHGTARAPRSVTEALVVGSQVIFVDTVATSYDSFPWDLYVVDWKTGVEKHLASDSDFGINDPPMPSPTAIRPQVVDGQVYFVAVDRVRGGAIRSSVYRVPIGGGTKPELVVPGVQDVYADGKMLRVQRGGQLLQWDPSRGAEGLVAGSSIAATCGSYFNEGVAVTCSGKDKKLHIASKAHGRLTIDTGSQGTGYLDATSRWVAFSTESQAYVVDLVRHRLMRMKGSSVSPQIHFSGNELEYVRQHSGPPYDPSTPLIALLPKD